MEINIENNTVLVELLQKALKPATIKIKSLDEEDLDKEFTINTFNVISIEEDCLTDVDNSLMIWWRLWNPLEGKYVTMSNHFIEYEFIY